MSIKAEELKNKINLSEEIIKKIDSDVKEIVDNEDISLIANEICSENSNEKSNTSIIEELDSHLINLENLQNELTELEKQRISSVNKSKILELLLQIFNIQMSIKEFIQNINFQTEEITISNIKNDIDENLKEIKKIRLDLEKNDKRSIEIITIFTAIITIVVSLVITSNTWLNNAEKNSAIIAFIVPSLVAIISIITLLSFAGFMFPINEKKSILAGIIFGVILISIIIFSFILLPISH